MRLLLDTHIALWAISGDAKLSAQAREMIADPANEAMVSVIAIWEIAIKHALRQSRQDAIVVSGSDALALFGEAGFAILPVMPRHAAAVDDLPPHHADPFDRLLIAQALTEPLRLMTRDRRLTAYGAMVLPV